MALPVSLTRLKPDRSGSALEASDVRGKKITNRDIGSVVKCNVCPSSAMLFVTVFSFHAKDVVCCRRAAFSCVMLACQQMNRVDRTAFVHDDYDKD